MLTGGWQTSKENAYVQATRARHGTDWYLARDQLGEEGQDPDRITRLADRMNESRAHMPSIAYRETTDHGWDPTLDPLQIGWANEIERAMGTDAPDHDLSLGR